MRSRYSLAARVACLLAVTSRSLCAEPQDRTEGPESPASDGAEATAEARRHFKLGIKLYQDTNYSGALAEFEAAYTAKPSPSSLQNVALCQKALFRYREAAATLAELLAEHGAELREGEKKAVSDAIIELNSLVGSIVVNVEPADAKVTIDGRALSASEMHSGVVVNVGEHTLIADLPGYARLSRVVSVASGQKQRPIELSLKPSNAFLSIVANDPRAAIAVDGVTRAFHEWRGGVEPDTDHLIQVFREGYESYESYVNVALGNTLHIQARLGPRTDPQSTETLPHRPGAMPAPPPPRISRGYYGLLTLGVLALGQHPLDLTGTRSSSVMGSIGIRVGYRIWAPVALELALDYGRLEVDDAKGEGSDTLRQYSLSAARLGPNLRLLTTGKALRFSTTVGTGVVHHELVLEPVASDATLPGGRASGYDPYFLLELGLQLSLRHLLLGAGVVMFIDGATGLNEQRLEGAKNAFGSTDTLPLFGLAIHGGYSLW